MSQDKLAIERETERALLGGIFRHPPALSDVAIIISPGDFREDAHRHLYAAVLALWDAGKLVDLCTVADRLEKSGRLQDAGGYPYLAEVYDSAPTGALAASHARMVREASLLRQLSTAGQAIAYSAENPAAPAEQVLQDAEKSIFAISQIGVAGAAIPLAEVVAETYDRIDARMRGNRTLSGASSGFDSLDALTAGWQNSELIIVAARPSVGKTSIGLTFARKVAEDGGTVFISSIEQSRTELVERLMCADAGVDSQRVRRGRASQNDMERLVAAGAELAKLPLFIDDSPGQSVLRIASNARRLKIKHKLALILVDYLQLVDPDSKKEPRHEQVAGISRRLKAIARELEVPVMALAQLNRNSENRSDSRPKLSDLRESGQVEQDADVVILLHRPDPTREELELLIEKQRNGPTGELTFLYDRSCMRFAESIVHLPIAGQGGVR